MTPRLQVIVEEHPPCWIPIGQLAVPLARRASRAHGPHRRADQMSLKFPTWQRSSSPAMRALLLCVCATAWMLSVHAADGRRGRHRHREASLETGRPGEEEEEEEVRGPAGVPQSEPPRKGR